MPIMNTITDAIANPNRVRASQERASERRFQGLEQKMAAIRDVSPEYTPSISSGQNSSLSSRAPSQDRQTRPALMRHEFQRSQSELPIQVRSTFRKPEFTPCITAMDLTSEQIKRNYSHDDLQKWDKSKYPLPPLAAMKGNYRYRTAAAADAQWRNEHFKKQISGLDGLDSMVAELDMKEMTGMSKHEWQELTGTNTRRDSAVSSSSAKTASTASDGAADHQTGPRVYRGFSPTRSSSTRSSFHSRKGSSLSIMNLPPDVDASLFQLPLQRQSTLVNDERRVSNPLSTINELQSNVGTAFENARKFQRPCEFSDRGDPDSAVASDVEDEGDEEWSDIAETQPPAVSVIAQMLTGGKDLKSQPGLTRVRTTSNDKKRGRASTVGLDRLRTVRNAQPFPARRHSKTKILHHERVRSNDEKVKATALAWPNPETTEDDGSELTIQIRRPANTEREGNKTQKQSGIVGSGDKTLVGKNQSVYPPHAPRNRSATAIFCRDDVQATTTHAQQKSSICNTRLI